MTLGAVNIAAHLAAMAKREPHRAAVVFPHVRVRPGRAADDPGADGGVQPGRPVSPAGGVAYTHLTFAQLERESNLLAAGLDGVGIARGARIVLMVKPSLDFFTLTFALFKLGAVPVLVDPGMGVANLKKCLREAEPGAFIGIAKAQLARVLLRWPGGTIRICAGGSFPGTLPLAEVRARGEKLPPFAMARTRAEETAAILFTSGSTGVPKGAVYSHGIFAAQVELLRDVFGIEPGEIDLCTFPLFALFAPALGMTAIIPDMDFTRPGQVNPWRIAEAMADFGATNMFGSPALLRRVGLWGERNGARFPTLRRVISAGAPARLPDIRRFCTLLDAQAQVFTPYGATESLPVCNIGSRTMLEETGAATARGRGVCVGHPVNGMTLRIIAIDDEPIAAWRDDLVLPRGEIGEMAVRGPVVTRAYFNRDASTKLAKIHGADGEIWHRMGDVGYLDEDGRLWYCGRKAHRVITSEGTLFTIPCEGVFNAHTDVFRSALVGVRDGSFQKPVLCVELQNKRVDKSHESLFAELRELGRAHQTTRAIETFLVHAGFPVDIRHNSKIFREKLAVWAARRLKT